MNDDMPWVDLTPEEIQELRTNKQELTEYGKEKIRELTEYGKLRVYDKVKQEVTLIDDGSSWGKIQTPEMKLEVKEMTHEEMLEIAAQRELANQGINFTKRQLVLLTTALTLFYDEVSKTSTPEFKSEVMEIAEMVQDAAEKVQ